MDYAYLDCLRSTSATSRDQPAAASLPQFRIELRFICKLISSTYVLDQEHFYQPQLVSYRHHPLDISNDAIIDLRQFLDRKEARQIIRNELRNMDGIMGAILLRQWVDSALEKATEVVLSMPAKHNVVTITFRAVLQLYHIDVIQRLPVEEIIHDQNNYMVPAAESWINDQNLGKRTTLTEYSGDLTCAVCLEDYSGGGEVVSMPCVHYFHRDCIEKWLRTSHYCPVCRFKVPTSDEVEMLNDISD